MNYGLAPVNAQAVGPNKALDHIYQLGLKQPNGKEVKEMPVAVIVVAAIAVVGVAAGVVVKNRRNK